MAAFKAFDDQKDRMKRYCQEGMVKSEDLPSSSNMQETKKSLGLALKVDMKEALEIFSKTIVECLQGIEKIFLDPVNLDESELKTMDLILGSRIILKFFTGLSNSENGLMEVIEALRVWECSAPMVKKDRLNALIVALKNLKEPLTAGTVVRMLREGLPSRMDQLIDHLTETTAKTMGSIEFITLATWQSMASRSSLELSTTSIIYANPVATSSAIEATTSAAPDRVYQTSATREAMDKLQKKILEAGSALDKE